MGRDRGVGRGREGKVAMAQRTTRIAAELRDQRPGLATGAAVQAPPIGPLS